VAGDAQDVVRLDSSEDTVLALRADGRVVVWAAGQDSSLWTPPPGISPVEICAGTGGSGYVVCADGSVHAATDSTLAVPTGLNLISRVFAAPGGGFCAVRRDGTATFWGATQAPVTPIPAGLRDISFFCFGQRYALAMQRDGTLLGWGQLAPDQRYRIRRFTGSLAIPRDYADRVFPVHRSDHAWELIPNPNVPPYMAEDRPSVLESRLRGCIDAVFTLHTVVALKPQ
jgi:hypothetical protein